MRDDRKEDRVAWNRDEHEGVKQQRGMCTAGGVVSEKGFERKSA